MQVGITMLFAQFYSIDIGYKCDTIVITLVNLSTKMEMEEFGM